MSRKLVPLLLAVSLAPGVAVVAEESLLEPVTDAEWQEVLESHRGNLVVVDYWATWCIPCIERFPKMVELSERHADDDVTFIAFSLDDREDAGAMERAERFAREQGGRIDHVVTSEAIPDAFDHLGLLGIPAVEIYARDGTLARKLDADDPNDQFTDEDVGEAIRELLKE